MKYSWWDQEGFQPTLVNHGLADLIMHECHD